jgi:hypothetical protein
MLFVKNSFKKSLSLPTVNGPFKCIHLNWYMAKVWIDFKYPYILDCLWFNDKHVHL